jgi:hypothetical protein
MAQNKDQITTSAFVCLRPFSLLIYNIKNQLSSFGPLEFTFGLLAFWPFGLLVFWPFGLLAFWPFGLLAFFSPD